jgi:ubiquitin thioesterase OTU1
MIFKLRSCREQEIIIVKSQLGGSAGQESTKASLLIIASSNMSSAQQIKLRLRYVDTNNNPVTKFQATTVTIPSNANFALLQAKIFEQYNLHATNQRISYGYPPKIVQPNYSADINTIGIQNGDSINIQAVDNYNNQLANISNNSNSSENKAYSSNSSNIQKSNINSSGSVQPLKIHKIPDDNSCLFHAICYGLNQNLTQSSSYREIVAGTILSNPTAYPKEFLENKTPEEYAQLIMKPTTWGGQVELQVLSQYLNIQIAAIDIETGTLLLFNDNAKQRIYLIYSGIHYDCLEDSSTRTQTQFSATNTEIKQRAEEAARIQRKQGRFTNIRSFSLSCADCGQHFVGAAEASDHAKETRHQNFVEYSAK